MAVLEYDRVEGWEPLFDAWMAEIAPADVLQETASPQEYIEDAGALFLDGIGKDELTEFLGEKLAPHSLQVFHGTRVSDATLSAIRREGLKPLSLAGRRATLVAELQDHPRWRECEPRLDAALHRFGPGWERGGAGKREDDAVHACLSRNGLVKGCNHYLTHGAEVDNHIVREVFGDDSGLDLLAAKRKPYLISFALNFAAAEAAANPHGLRYEGLPFVTQKFLNAWAFRLGNRQWQPAGARISDALMGSGGGAPDRLTIEPLTDADLQR